MKKRSLLLYPTFLVVAGYFAFHTIFTIPEQPEMVTIADGAINLQLDCLQSHSRQSIDQQGELTLLVWNIYKQNRRNWNTALSEYADGAQLVLLQEASLDDPLKRWLASEGWHAQQVNAFKAFNKSAGVLTLAKHKPVLACGYTQLEPWLRLPKSALYSEYPLSNGSTLAVVNIHAVNFTLGVQAYQQQIDALVNALTKHQGPVILAGDFNSWNEERWSTLQDIVEKLALQEVVFQPDLRTRFITGRVLDHVFYRGLTLEKAKAPKTDASDHNPLLVSFKISAQTAPK